MVFRGLPRACWTPSPVTGAAADEYNLNVVDCNSSVTVARPEVLNLSQWGSGGYPQLWTLEYLFRGNVIIHRAHKAIQVDDCRPRRRSWLRFPQQQEALDFGVGSSWLRGHPQGPESNSGGWLPATSDVIGQVSPALSYPEPL